MIKLFIYILGGADELLVDSNPQIVLQKTLKTVGAGLILAAIFFYLFPHMWPEYAMTATSTGVLVCGLIALRPVARTFVRRQTLPENTLILGSEASAEALYEEMMRLEPSRRVVVVASSEISHLDQHRAVSRIVVAESRIKDNSKLVEALIDCKLRGVKIETLVDSYEQLNRKIWIQGLSPDWLIFARGFQPSRFYLAAKRVFDIVLGILVLIATAPLMVLIAAGIKLNSRGPVIFSQERVGLHGQTFIVYKFRSMRQNAEEHIGPTWAKENDDRVTAFGQFLRKCRLDEIPQVFNVLLGQMSFIGPRPERPYFVDLLKAKIRYYDARHYVKPGITGWAQVMYPYGASIEDAFQKLQYDLYYTKNASFRLDLLVLLRTIKVVLKGQGR